MYSFLMGFSFKFFFQKCFTHNLKDVGRIMWELHQCVIMTSVHVSKKFWFKCTIVLDLHDFVSTLKNTGQWSYISCSTFGYIKIMDLFQTKCSVQTVVKLSNWPKWNIVNILAKNWNAFDVPLPSRSDASCEPTK